MVQSQETQKFARRTSTSRPVAGEGGELVLSQEVQKFFLSRRSTSRRRSRR